MNKEKQKKKGIAEEKKHREPFKQYLKERLKDIPLTVVMALFAAYCIVCMIYFPVIGRWRDGLISLVYLCIVGVFYFLEWLLNIRVPIAYTVFLMLFVLFCHLGACFNMYYTISYLDDILHAAWGIVFGTIGVMLIKAFMGVPKSKKAVVIYVLFGLGFAMLMSILWEVWEFTMDSIMPDMDMQQDTVVDYIHSFIMYPDPENPSPDNLHTWQVEGIAKTVLYDADGNVIGTIYGGYLDLGLRDTMWDLIFCTGFVTIFSVVLAIDWCKGKYIYRYFIPALTSEVDEWKSQKAAAKEPQPISPSEEPTATTSGNACEETTATEEKPD